MNLRDLRYLLAVAEHRHFGRAAEACFVTQPTLSKQLRKLEETLGVALVERGRNVRLTPVGQRVAAQAGEVLRGAQAVIQLAAEHRDPLGGVLRLGVIPTIAPYLLPLVLPAVAARLPKLRLEIVEGRTADLLNLLAAAEIDAAVMALPAPAPDIEAVALYDEPFYFAVSPRHRLAERRAVAEAELHDEDVLLLEDGHCLRDQALAICHSARASANPNFRAASLETLRQLVAADLGVTLMPALAANRALDVRYIPFSGAAPRRTVGLCSPAPGARREVLAALAAALREGVRRGADSRCLSVR